MAGKFELKKAKNGQFFFSLLAGNKEKILTSEMYNAKTSAKNGIKSVKKNSRNEARYERKKSKGGKSYFVLRAGNYQVIGTSEEYNSATAMENGIKSVKTNAPSAKTEDKS